MILLDSIAKISALPVHQRRVLVPTMGALHAGHASLIQQARRIAGDDGEVIVSIFVNPTQFDRAEDLAQYPSSLAEDLGICQSQGADFVFAPQPEEIYQNNRSIAISESSLSQRLCGATRPGHFDGVCLVVTKLFNLTRATHAIFGEKDFQQLAIIRRLVRDLNIPIEVMAGPTVREPSGLAMSSRNQLLSPKQKTQAAAIHQALLAAARHHASGERSAAKLIQLAKSKIETIPCRPTIDYLEIVDAETLSPVDQLEGQPAVIAIAIFFGKVRLIDNQALDASTSSENE